MENVDSIFNSVVAITIKKYREEKNMSLESVVKNMKNPVSRQALFKYENGKARIKMETFLDICDALKINPKMAFDEINSKTMEIARDISKEKNIPIDVNLFDFVEKKFTNVKTFANKKMFNNFLKENDCEILENTFEENCLNQLKAYNEIEDVLDKYKNILSSYDINYLKQIIERRKKNLYKQLEE